MQLTLNGDTSYRTIPGGCISVFIGVVVWAYAIVQLKIMVTYEDWSLVHQNTLMNPYELAKRVDMRDFENVTVALQFNQRRKALTAAEWERVLAAEAEQAQQREREENQDQPPEPPMPPEQGDATGLENELESLLEDNPLIVDDPNLKANRLSLAEQYAKYNQTVAEVARFLSVQGMFEVRDGITYYPFDGIN